MTAPTDRSLQGLWGGAWGRPVAMTAQDADMMVGRIAFAVRQAAQMDMLDLLKQSALTEADLRAALWQIQQKNIEISQLRQYIEQMNAHVSKMTPLAGVPVAGYPSSVPPIQQVQYQSRIAAEMTGTSPAQNNQLPAAPTQ